MKTVDEVRRAALVRFQRNKKLWLSMKLKGEAFVPVEFPLNAPTRRASQVNLQSTAKWVRQWRSAAPLGVLKEVHKLWPMVKEPVSVPERLVFESVESLLDFIGDAAESECWKRSQVRLTALSGADNAALREALIDEWKAVSQAEDAEYERVLRTVFWLMDHRPAGCFIREMPVEGVHTKWLERHRDLAARLLSAVTGRNFTAAGFIAECGFKQVPVTVRVRHAGVFIPGIGADSLVELPAAELARHQPRALVIFENIQTGLSTAVPAEVPIIMGLGFDVSILAEIPWIRKVPIFYAGDLDVHGLAILACVRRIVPQVRSFMMDLETLECFRQFAVADPTRGAGIKPEELTASESMLFMKLKAEKLRLEQERLPIAKIDEEIQRLIDGLTDHADLRSPA